MKWQPIETAPKDGTPFLALNHDREVWVSKFDQYGRVLFRTNALREPRRFEIVRHNDEELLREDKQYAAENERWESNWTIWTRGYEFKPTHWAPLTPPPEAP